MFKIVDCKCSTYALTEQDDWNEIKKGNHHPSCFKSWRHQKEKIIYLCKLEIDTALSDAQYLAEKILEILDEKSTS